MESPVSASVSFARTLMLIVSPFSTAAAVSGFATGRSLVPWTMNRAVASVSAVPAAMILATRAWSAVKTSPL